MKTNKILLFKDLNDDISTHVYLSFDTSLNEFVVIKINKNKDDINNETYSTSEYLRNASDFEKNIFFERIVTLLSI